MVCCSQPSTSSVKEASRQRCRTEIYNHFTCATDTEGIRVVFDAVIDLVIFMHISFFCYDYLKSIQFSLNGMFIRISMDLKRLLQDLHIFYDNDVYPAVVAWR